MPVQRRSLPRPPSLLLAIVLALGLTAPPVVARTMVERDPAKAAITVTRIVGGFDAPVDVRGARDGTNRLFVVERRGTIRVVQAGKALPGFFLDAQDVVVDGGERGLLGLAFHPDFRTNRHLYVTYTRSGGDIVIARYTANSARTAVPRSSFRALLVIEHSAATNHNGGSMAFGPDGYLYVGIGDGGGSGDPENDAQSITRNLLGKLIRIDVDGTGAGPFGRYAIPAGNPYRGRTGLDEIWAYGLRNPWRIAFDRGTGALWIADVGQGEREEVDRQSATAAPGRNYGWNVMEGTRCYRPSACPLAGDTLPVAEYAHTSGNCSITGGQIYRGTKRTGLIGQYLFGDFCSGRIWSMPVGATDAQVLRADTTLQITSFGEADDGEIVVVSLDGWLHSVTSP